MIENQTIADRAAKPPESAKAGHVTHNERMLGLVLDAHQLAPGGEERIRRMARVRGFSAGGVAEVLASDEGEHLRLPGTRPPEGSKVRRALAMLGVAAGSLDRLEAEFHLDHAGLPFPEVVDALAHRLYQSPRARDYNDALRSEVQAPPDPSEAVAAGVIGELEALGMLRRGVMARDVAMRGVVDPAVYAAILARKCGDERTARDLTPDGRPVAPPRGHPLFRSESAR